MVCKNCKNEIQKGSSFCAHCGAPVKKNKHLAGGGILLLVLALVLFFISVFVYKNKSQDLESAIALYEKAIEEGDEDKLYRAMFPQDIKSS